MIAVIAMILSVTAFFSPWWSETRQEEESPSKIIFHAGLSDFSSEEIRTENQYKYTCPGCGDMIASTEESLDYYKCYLCPHCEERNGYSYQSLDDLKSHCPECGRYVGNGATSCNRYGGGCDAEFSEPVVWCDNCDMEIIPIEGYYCRDCDDAFPSLDKKIRGREGDSRSLITPLSNSLVTEAEKEDGLINKADVANVTYYIWLIGLILSGIAIIALLFAAINRTNSYVGIISLGLAVLITLVGVIYFAAAWGGAYDKDWEDSHDENDEGNGDFILVDDPSEQVVSGFWGSKRYEPGDDEKYTDYIWGPGSGWILGLTSVCLGSFAMVFLFLTKKELEIKTGTEKVEQTSSSFGDEPSERIEPALSNSYETLYGATLLREHGETSQFAHNASPPPQYPYKKSIFRNKAESNDEYGTRPMTRPDQYDNSFDRSHRQPSKTYGVRKRRFPPPPY